MTKIVLPAYGLNQKNVTFNIFFQNWLNWNFKIALTLRL